MQQMVSLIDVEGYVCGSVPGLLLAYAVSASGERSSVLLSYPTHRHLKHSSAAIQNTDYQ